MDPVIICVDVMGGDREPKVVLDGIVAALEADSSIKVLASGPKEIVVPFADAHERVEALIAPEVITMEDDPIQAVLTRRKSSIVLGCRSVKKGAAHAFFSAGATGAVTAAATAYVTPFKYVDDDKIKPVRPALTSALPNMKGSKTVLSDMGANPDVEPMDMVHFGQMAYAYAKLVLGISEPRVGLLSNGTEEGKGNEFVKACYPLMKKFVPGFVGNREGGDCVNGSVDVMIANGFDGNIALKSFEQSAKFLMGELKTAFSSTLLTKLAAVIMKPKLREIKNRFNSDNIGGAILLGLKGVVFIGHGATSVNAVKNGILSSAQCVRANLVEQIANSLENIRD